MSPTGDGHPARVYLAGKRGTVWHWPKHEPRGTVCICTGWNLRVDTAEDPSAIHRQDRCGGSGCNHQWEQWHRANPTDGTR